MDGVLPYICVAGTAFAVTYLTTPFAKRLATYLNAIDYPGKRRINTEPIPRMGGVAIFLGLCAALIVQYAGTVFLGWPSVAVSHESMDVNYTMLGIAVAIVFVTGAVDDVYQLNPKAKLAGQVLGAVVAVASGVVISRVINPFDTGPWLQLGFWGYPITVVYLVAFTNIINLIDGLDGLATGITAIAGVSMLNYALLFGRVDAAALCVALVAACLAFLRFNFHPASIFLGDSGALMLGFLLGIVSLLNVSRTAALTSLLVPLIVAGVPIIDTFSAIVRRSRAHVRMDVADKGHIHHRLIREGYNQRQAVLIIYAWCILLAVGAAVIVQVSVGLRVLIFIVLALSSIGLAMRLHLFEPVLRHHYNADTHEDELVTPDDPAFAEEKRAQESHGRRTPRRPGPAGEQPEPAPRSEEPAGERQEDRSAGGADSRRR